tara:strand:+ start:2857 stop:3174 length:318 start_codon:yes stop_codon:yes gene_type:complete
MGWTYHTPENVANDGPQITAVAIALTSASLCVLLLRLYVRGWMIKAVGSGMYQVALKAFRAWLMRRLPPLDDWNLIITWVSRCVDHCDELATYSCGRSHRVALLL